MAIVQSIESIVVNQSSDQSPVSSSGTDKCRVTLRFFGDRLDPNSITEVLGVQPTKSCRKGDIFHGKVRDRIEKTGKWIYRSDEWKAIHLEDQINQLLDRLPENLDVWHELTANFQADLFCGWSVKRSNPGIFFLPETLKRIVDRGLGFGLDIYFSPEEDEQS
ncbi:DUF4279 domain-containing protein [Microcoleus sp. FACHB-1515]|uniref:DUF4279 domain-containing protein n=1 Tax=Cyanophyceae TaxID=3028117 RepID=UPI0016826278|nr:DUF4279 domain-containing protein [Microcoleus sp. FACHB-1515]MBD2090253.1 DUF4279 domain-containing protein [Microcoleus sp. FACHB-1515]